MRLHELQPFPWMGAGGGGGGGGQGGQQQPKYWIQSLLKAFNTAVPQEYPRGWQSLQRTVPSAPQRDSYCTICTCPAIQ